MCTYRILLLLLDCRIDNQRTGYRKHIVSVFVCNYYASTAAVQYYSEKKNYK